VDVTELLLHQGVRLKDVAVNPKWTPITDPDSMLVHVIMPKAEEAPAPAAEGTAAATPTATAEPEVIKKGKKEDEEEDKKK
jgi:large subunit ribosomal protein L25